MEQSPPSISIRPLGDSDLSEAGAILRRAFAAQFGMPPDTFWTDRDFVTGRWMTDPSLAFGAWMGDRLVGSSLGTSWGSLGIFGPISTHPDTWNHGTARLLIPPVLERLNALGARHLAFFTFAESTKHIALYQRFGFWPRFLTAIMTRLVEANEIVPETTRYSTVAGGNTHCSHTWTRRQRLSYRWITNGGGGFVRVWTEEPRRGRLMFDQVRSGSP